VSSRLRAEKQALRREIRARRDAMPPEERASRSSAIADRVLTLPEVATARTVMLFSSFGSEVDTAPIVDRLVGDGRTVLLPRVEDGDIVAVPWRPGEPLRPGAFGAGEPVGDAADPAEIDLVLTPGLAFDRRGNRIGYGGGNYDRFLGRVRRGVPAIAIAFATQIVPAVPAVRADRPVDAVVTEDEVIRPGVRAPARPAEPA
jgi:5-formyltetrahydrofolate cyclo-ligase